MVARIAVAPLKIAVMDIKIWPVASADVMPDGKAQIVELAIVLINIVETDAKILIHANAIVPVLHVHREKVP